MLDMELLNFLPPEQKKQRLALVVLELLQEMLSVLLVVLLTVALIAGISRSILERVAATESVGLQTNEEKIAKKISSLRSEIKQLQSLHDQERWQAPVLADLIGRLSRDITLRSFIFDTAGEKMTIHGHAATRDALTAFQAKVNESTYFEHAALPLSTLAKPVNIDFDLSADLTELPSPSL